MGGARPATEDPPGPTDSSSAGHVPPNHSPPNHSPADHSPVDHPLVDHPLVAPRVDSTVWSSGMPLVTDAEALQEAVSSGEWKDSALDGLGLGLDIAATALDPLGMLAANGIGWLIEHVRPLSELLDKLTGDPDAVTAAARTWRNVSTAVHTAADQLRAAGAPDAGWRGAAADAFTASTIEQSDHLHAAATAADTLAAATEGAGQVVSAVRDTVRDLISQLAATLIERVPQWTLEEAGTLGIATPHVMAAALTVITRSTRRAVTLIRAVITSLGRLGELLARTRIVFDHLAAAFTHRAAATGATSPMAASRAASDTVPGTAPGTARGHNHPPTATAVSPAGTRPHDPPTSTTPAGPPSPDPHRPSASTGLTSRTTPTDPHHSPIRHALEPTTPRADGRVPTHRDRHGFLTDGRYRSNSAANNAHGVGRTDMDRSVFFPNVDPDRLALDAARRADEQGSWAAARPGDYPSKAKVVFEHPVGIHSRTGEPTYTVNVYRRKSRTIRASPGSPAN